VAPAVHAPPVFCAGPKHDTTSRVDAVDGARGSERRVRLVLAGHEHNFQHSAAEGITYIVTARPGSSARSRRRSSRTRGTLGWAAEPHLLLVELTSARATLWPVRSVAEDGFAHLHRRRRTRRIGGLRSDRPSTGDGPGPHAEGLDYDRTLLPESVTI
jgi:hypothetical protein